MRHGPLSVSCETSQKMWSGKEDSNLRPLPPEDASPSVTRRIYDDFCRTIGAPVAVCSRLVRGNGSFWTLNPCLRGLPPIPHIEGIEP